MDRGKRSTESDISSFVDQADGKKTKEEVEYVPSYRVVGDARIPVSKALGQLWYSRKSTGVQRLEASNHYAMWQQCIDYYNNDQAKYRENRDTTEISKTRLETENIVFANTSALVPAIYAKNPDIEVTPNDKQSEEKAKLATVAERLVNALFARYDSPGINLKPKVRKGVIMTTLTNISWIEVGYTKRETSSASALEDLGKLAQDLEEAKTVQEIRAIEGKLQALELKTAMLRPPGPWARFRDPKDVVVDFDAEILTDANWMMVADYVQTDLLQACYGKKDSDGNWESIFKPSHILKLSTKEGDQQEGHDGPENFSLFDGNKHADYGYENEDSFKSAQRTKVWYVWDKITRRVYLFNDKDWKWPIWVWNDPYHLDTFFPLYPLEFYTSPTHAIGKSEVAYYLDQQDGINTINSEYRKWMKYAIDKIVVNRVQGLGKAEIEKFLKGDDIVLDVQLPEGTKLEDFVRPWLPPSAQVGELFDKTRYYEAIDRVSSVTGAMRGVEYKTNTTNRAIENYESTTQTRLDEKIDAQEEQIGRIGWAILQMCAQFMTGEEVAKLLDDPSGKLWDSLPKDPEEIQKMFSFRVVGGSALKPTAKTKKEEAVQMTQVLGTFASAAPAAIEVILKMMERAFDELTITKEDWQSIRESISRQLDRGDTSQGPSQQQQGASATGVQGGQTSGSSPDIGQVEQIFTNFSIEQKQAFARAILQGLPLVEAFQAAMQGQ